MEVGDSVGQTAAGDWIDVMTLARIWNCEKYLEDAISKAVFHAIKLYSTAT